MFLADVALGNAYVPKSYAEPLPKPGYDSTFAQANVSGVRNNEMIVYQTSQVNLRYLVEFAAV
jgi:poly [ADP-ribose] polymerase